MRPNFVGLFFCVYFCRRKWERKGAADGIRLEKKKEGDAG